jgi:hypothetical protein
VIEKHEYNYKCTNLSYKAYANEISHGLYIITSQGYSWSHSHKSEDDIFR